VATAEAELSRLNERLFQIGPPTPAEAFVVDEAEQLSPWTAGYALAAFVVGAAIGALLAVAGLVAYSRRRRPPASTLS
jgi:MprA protease rhombosortase-interaction domain-containing protein